MEADEIDLRRVFDLLRRRFWLIALVTLASVAVGGLALLALKPVYTATALVLVDPSKKNLLDPETQFTGSSSDSLRVDSEVELVKSEPTLISVANKLNLSSDPEFGLSLGIRDTLLAFFRIAEPRIRSREEALAAVLGSLRNAVTVQRRGLTFLISIGAKSRRPDFAAQIANAVADEYIQQQLQAKEDSVLASRDKIQQRLAEASDAVAGSERSFDDFIDSNLTRITEATGRTDLAEIRAQIDSLIRDRAQATAAVNLVERNLREEDWEAVASGLQDEAIANLERQRTELLARLQAAGGADTEASIRQGIDDLEEQLKRAATEAVDGLKRSVQDSQARTSELRTELRSTVLDSSLPADILANLYALQQNAEIARVQYQTLLTRQQDLNTQAFLQIPDARVVAAATPPSEPSFPNPRLILALAAVVGLGLGVGLAFLVENFVGGFTSEGQAEALLRAPVVSTIPRYRPSRKRGQQEGLSLADAMVSAPLSSYAEAIRRAKVGIDQTYRRSTPDGDRKLGMVLMISSAAPGEGKSTLGLSLMRAYGMAGQATLLIDCDLRRPSIHRQLGIEPSEGLLEYLSDETEEVKLDSILAVDEASGARIIRGSRRSDVPTDQLVSSGTFRRLLGAAREHFDVIILDTPPVGPVVDGLYLAEMADVILYVIKWSATPQQQVRRAVASLNSSKRPETPLLLMLNQQNARAAGYGSKYGAYYGYN